MAQFEITSPEGDVYEVTAPEGATEKEALDYAKANYTPLEQTENIESATEPEKSESYKGSRLDRDAEGNAIGTWDETPIFDPVTKTNIPRVGNKLLNKIIPQPKKIPAQLMRQLGLAGRGGVEGLSEAGDFITSPVRFTANTLLGAKDKFLLARDIINGRDKVSDKGFADLITGGSSKKEPFKIKPLTETVTTPGLNSMGVPYAEDKGERINQEMIKYLPFTGGVNSIAKLFKPTSTMGKNIQKTFVENQGRQLVSTSVVGGSQQYLKEEGVGTAGQIGYSFALGMLPFIGMKSSITKPIYKDRKLTKTKIKKADELINNYEYQIAQNLNDGLDIIESSKLARAMLKISPTKLAQTLINTDREIPTFLNRYGTLDNKLIQNAIKTNPNKGYEPATGFSGWVSDTLSPISTIIKKISEPIYNRLRLHDFSEQINTTRRLEVVKPFLKVISQIKKSDLPLYNKLERDLNNGYQYKVIKTLQNLDSKIIKKLKMSPKEIINSFKNTNKILSRIFNDLQGVGLKLARRQAYFPRKVNDLDGLYARLGTKKTTALQTLLNNRAIKLGLKDSEDGTMLARDKLGSDEVAAITNNFVNKQGTGSLGLGKSGYLKGRTAGDVSETTQPYYQDAIDRLPDYIRKTQREIELRKFFGKDVAENEINKIDMNSSIGAIIAKERESGNVISEKSLNKLSDLLHARFIKGPQAPDNWVSSFKDYTYLTTIANPYSAIVQTGDISQSANQTSLWNAVKALAGKKIAKLSDVGLDNVITAEIQSESRLSSKLLNKGLTGSGFRRVDRLGKETAINAAWNEARDLFSPKAIGKTAENARILFKNKWGKVYGDEYQSFETALKSGELTDNVRLYMWHKLSDTQPISLSEMPLHYLNMRNGRAFYSLMSFTIKQLDIMKRTIADEFAKGNIVNGTRAATRYATIVGGGNTTVELANDFAKGRDININTIPQKWLFNIVKNFGVSEYAWDKTLSDGNFGDWIGDLWMPPSAVLSPAIDVAKIYDKAVNKDEELTVDDFLKLGRKFPIAGSPAYNLLGEGAEKYNDRLNPDDGLPISDWLGIDPIIENPINFR
jgi:hypothetical protein